MERRFEFVRSRRGVRTTPWIRIVLLAALCLIGANVLQAQAPITFSYFYDDLGQLKKVVDSTGIMVDYVYDAVGNILEVKRSAAPGALTIFSFTPNQGAPLSNVVLQGKGFASTPSADLVKFNGVAATVLSATSDT